MSITARPGDTFTAIAEGFATGLTLGVTIDNGDGTTHTPRTTVGIVEIGTSGVYVKDDFTAPVDAGTYIVLWDNGTGGYATEELVVTYSQAALAAPSGYDLTSVDAVRELLQPEGGEQDTVIQREITRLSVAIRARYGKFRPAETGTKRFVVSNGSQLARIPLYPYFCRSVTNVVWAADQTTTTTLVSTDYQLRPTSPVDGVYRWLRLPAYRTVTGGEVTVDVTGDWGFTTVPDDVEEACILAVKERIVRDVSAFSRTFPEDDGAPARPLALPLASRLLLAPYDQQGQG